MSERCEEPRFTIEQIDLLQRLRRSGMSRPEIIHALDTLERLERQHGHKHGPRRPPRAPPGAGPSPFSSEPPSSRVSTATQTAFPPAHADAGLSPSPPANGYATSPPLLSTTTPVAMLAAGPSSNGLVAAVTNGRLSPQASRFPVAVDGGVAAPAYVFDAGEEDMDVDDKVEELMRRDSSMIKEEIKAFLGNRRISQAVVAQVTGISQSRISHWLLQQGSDLSEQKKRAFFRWYQLEKNNPGATLAMRASAPLALEDMVEWQQAPPPISSTPGSFRLRRGSRFTWRKECLTVMESYFNDNQYPDEAKREEIANACNAVIQKPGKKLSDLERVTSLKVYNWFANRRKEIKRRANIAILESHGIEVQSPGGHSNSDEVDGNDFPDQGCEVTLFDKRVTGRAFGLSRLDLSSPTQVPASLLPSWLAAWPALGRGAGLVGQRGGSLIGRSLTLGAEPQGSSEASRLTGVSWSPPSPTSLQDDPSSTNHSSLAEPQDPISLAVEMAAVNHSILALANQAAVAAAVAGSAARTGSEIKTEALEDEEERE